MAWPDARRSRRSKRPSHLASGRSGAGKSTLAAFLAAHDYDYISYDLVALRDDGNVMPWPTPFSIKRGSWRVIAPLYSQFDSLDEVELYSRRIKFVPVGSDPWTRPPQRFERSCFLSLEKLSHSNRSRSRPSMRSPASSKSVYGLDIPSPNNGCEAFSDGSRRSRPIGWLF